MHARIGRISFSPDKAEETTNNVKQNVVPRLEQQDGFKGFTLLIDRSSGEGLGISFWNAFNFAPIAVAVVIVFAGIYWVASARKWFKGPVVQGSPEELKAIERDLEAV